MKFRALGFAITLVLGSFVPALSQKGSCPVAPASLDPAQPDIFNAEQEQWLGEAVAESIETGYRMVPVAAADDYLTVVGQKLLSALPQSKMKFLFQIYESDEINAFSLPGGRVYVSSKMVAAFKSEDELAAVLAHEIGHIVTHQAAIEMTALLRKNLKVTQLGDRADVFRKFHELQSTPVNDSGSGQTSEKDQDVADRVGLYALTRAGYQPSAFARIFDFTVNNKGKKGNGLLDVLGYTNEGNRRYREAVKIAETTPASCVGVSTADPAKFAAWQQRIAERKINQLSASQENEKSVTLSPPLGSDLDRIVFSPDGKFLLAQDETSVFVLESSPLKLVFTIPAGDGMGAHFSSDSAEIIFYTGTLRVETWSIATQKRVALSEVVYPNCLESALSPDGKVLLCVTATDSLIGTPSLGVTLLDTSNSQVLLEKTSLFAIGRFMTGVALTSILRAVKGTEPLVNVSFSTDSRILLLGTADRTFSYDLSARKEISQQGALKKLGGRHFTFLDDNRVLIENPENPKDSELVSYPDGKLIKKISMGVQGLSRVTKGNYALLRPLKGAMVGALDLDSGKLVIVSHSYPMDVFGTLVARQTPTGGVQLEDLVKPQDKPQFIRLPLTQMDSLEAATVSPDGKYLAISTWTRGGIWNLSTGQRRSEMRPFLNAFFSDNTTAYLDFRKYEDASRTVGMIDFATGSGRDMGYVLNDKTFARGNLFLEMKGPSKDATPDELQVRDAASNHVLWSKKFKEDLPYFLACVCGGNLTFWWYLEEAGAKEELDAHPNLKPFAAAIQDKRSGIIVEVIDQHTGDIKMSAVLQDKHSQESRYKFVSRNVSTFKDYALVRGVEQTTAVFHLPDGQRVGDFFGEVVARDPRTGWVIVASKVNELEIFDVATTRELKRMTFAAPVRSTWFALAPKTIQVLTADQTVHTIEVTAAGSTTSPAK